MPAGLTLINISSTLGPTPHQLYISNDYCVAMRMSFAADKRPADGVLSCFNFSYVPEFANIFIVIRYSSTSSLQRENTNGHM